MADKKGKHENKIGIIVTREASYVRLFRLTFPDWLVIVSRKHRDLIEFFPMPKTI